MLDGKVTVIDDDAFATEFAAARARALEVEKWRIRQDSSKVDTDVSKKRSRRMIKAIHSKIALWSPLSRKQPIAGVRIGGDFLATTDLDIKQALCEQLAPVFGH